MVELAGTPGETRAEPRIELLGNCQKAISATKLLNYAEDKSKEGEKSSCGGRWRIRCLMARSEERKGSLGLLCVCACAAGAPECG